MIYYIDIGVDTTGYDGLSKETPKGFNEFEAMISNPVYAPDTFRLRGFKLLTTDLNIQYATSIERWDGFLEDPWRFKSTTDKFINSNFGLKIEGGITSDIFFNVDVSFQMLNCYLYNADFTFLNTGIHSFKGCTIYSSNWTFGNDLSILIRDTILHIDMPSHTDSSSKIIFEHSATNLTKSSINSNELWKSDTDDGHTIFDWNSYVNWPNDAFTVTSEELTLPNIFLKGSNVYTGYNFDLFGNTRNGIGAVAPLKKVTTKEGIMFFLAGDNSFLVLSNSVGEGIL